VCLFVSFPLIWFKHYRVKKDGQQNAEASQVAPPPQQQVSTREFRLNIWRFSFDIWKSGFIKVIFKKQIPIPLFSVIGAFFEELL